MFDEYCLKGSDIFINEGALAWKGIFTTGHFTCGNNRLWPIEKGRSFGTQYLLPSDTTVELARRFDRYSPSGIDRELQSHVVREYGEFLERKALIGDRLNYLEAKKAEILERRKALVAERFSNYRRKRNSAKKVAKAKKNLRSIKGLE
jgi:hypothetical protein